MMLSYFPISFQSTKTQMSLSGGRHEIPMDRGCPNSTKSRILTGFGPDYQHCAPYFQRHGDTAADYSGLCRVPALQLTLGWCTRMV